MLAAELQRLIDASKTGTVDASALENLILDEHSPAIRCEIHAEIRDIYAQEYRRLVASAEHADKVYQWAKVAIPVTIVGTETITVATLYLLCQ